MYSRWCLLCSLLILRCASVSWGLARYVDQQRVTEQAYQAVVTGLQNVRRLDYLEGEAADCGIQYLDFLASNNVNQTAQYFDSFGKPGAGFMDGNNLWVGYYDECIDLGNTNFCLFPFSIGAFPSDDSANLIQLPINIALCYPSSCTLNGFVQLVNISVGGEYYIKELNYNVSVSIDNENAPFCSWRNLKWTAGSIIALLVCCILLSLVLLGTAVELFLWGHNLFQSNKTGYSRLHGVFTSPPKYDDDDDEHTPLTIINKRKLESFESKSESKQRCVVFVKEFFLSFSLYKTIPTILATHQPEGAITSINGIRVISMFWVILGHTFLWGLDLQTTANVLEAVEAVPKKFSFQPVANSFLSVDSFFVMSGLLLSYLGVKEISRRKGKFPFLFFYLHRILRLSPAYFFMLLVYFKLSPHVGSGPLWYIADIARCSKYWWTNILYINNFYPTSFSDQCYGVTWYLANDMQFFIISPLFLMTLYWNWKIGFATIGAFMTGSIVIIGTLVGTHSPIPNANLLQSSIPNGAGEEERANLANFAFSAIYEKPYCRINAYLVGIVLGYILYKKWQVRRSLWTRLTSYCGMWTLAAVLCLLMAYGQYKTWNGQPFSDAENVMWFMFSRTLWSTGLALVIYCCHNGFGGAVNTFLSWGVWVPLSRLTFMAYLAHPMVLQFMYGTMQFRFIYTAYILAIFVIAAVVLAYSMAMVVAVVVEYPLANVESAVYKLIGIKARPDKKAINADDEET